MFYKYSMNVGSMNKILTYYIRLLFFEYYAFGHTTLFVYCFSRTV